MSTTAKKKIFLAAFTIHGQYKCIGSISYDNNSHKTNAFLIIQSHGQEEMVTGTTGRMLHLCKPSLAFFLPQDSLVSSIGARSVGVVSTLSSPVPQRGALIFAAASPEWSPASIHV